MYTNFPIEFLPDNICNNFNFSGNIQMAYNLIFYRFENKNEAVELEQALKYIKLELIRLSNLPWHKFYLKFNRYVSDKQLYYRFKEYLEIHYPNDILKSIFHAFTNTSVVMYNTIEHLEYAINGGLGFKGLEDIIKEKRIYYNQEDAPIQVYKDKITSYTHSLKSTSYVQINYRYNETSAIKHIKDIKRFKLKDLKLDYDTSTRKYNLVTPVGTYDFYSIERAKEVQVLFAEFILNVNK